MRNTVMHWALIAAVLGGCSIVHGQGQAITVEDGRVILNGTYRQLAGIEVQSEGGYLTLDTILIPELDLRLPDKTPFSLSHGTVVQDTPNSIVIGVLGADKRIDIEGRTPTGILYSESAEFARFDLSVSVGLGDDPPGTLTCTLCPEPSSSGMLLLGLMGLVSCRTRRVPFGNATSKHPARE